MALYTKTQFAELIGKKHNYLSVIIKRGNIVVSADDLIDSENVTNALWLQKYQAKKLSKGESANSSTAAASESPEKPAVRISRTNEVTEAAKLETRKRLLDVELKEEELRLAKLKVAKLNGTLIPTDSVTGLFTVHFKSVFVAFENAAGNFLDDISLKYQLSGKDVAYFRGKLIEIMNKSIDESIANSQKDLRNIVAEHSESRGRGERK